MNLVAVDKPDKATPGGARLLLVEDSPDDAELIELALRQSGQPFTTHRVDSAHGMAAALADGGWDLVISDYNLPGFSGPHALALLRARAPDTPFIVVSGFIGEEAATGLMKAGADDYVMKDDLTRLAPAVERSLKEACARMQRGQAEQALRESEARFKAIASNLPGMVLQLVLRADRSWSIPYVSDGSQALLGIEPRKLRDNPDSFFDLIVPSDSESFADSMRVSLRELSPWNWEGRMHVNGSEEIKWVNLRSSPRRLDDGRLIWEGILSNITQSKQAEIDARRSREDLSRLSVHIQKIKELERTRIAREIHDGLGGTLTAIKIDLIRLGTELGSGSVETARRLQALEALIDIAMDATHRIATALRPGILDLGIVAAIEWQCAEFSKRMDIPCRISCAQEEIELDDETSIALFRIFQENLTNIAKHAGARLVEVELGVSEDRVELMVRDDGCGISTLDLAKQGVFGILGMRERVFHLGGKLRFRAIPCGTEVRVSLPQVSQGSHGAAAAQEPGGLVWRSVGTGVRRLDSTSDQARSQ